MMSTTNKMHSIAIALRALPFCLCLMATALVIQEAYALRTEMTVADEVSSSLIYWIHPAAIVTLLLGYALSLAALVSSMKKRSPKL